MDVMEYYPQTEILDFCRRWNIKRLELFGSAVTGKLTQSSDIDLLVEFMSSFKRTLVDQMKMQEELERIFEREVDFIVRETIEKSPNPYKRDSILNNTRVLYVAG